MKTTLKIAITIAAFFPATNLVTAQTSWTGTTLGILTTNPANTNVGINTGATPAARLHVFDGTVFFDGANGAFPTTWTSVGSRMLWYPAKKAFRAGQTTSTQWDDANIGVNSFAANLNTIASGAQSCAFGNGTASGIRSVAFGSGVASNTGAVAFAGTSSGTSSVCLSGTASGNSSLCGGHSAATASGLGAFAFGFSATAYGYYSTAFGHYSNAESGYEMVIGQFNELLPTGYLRSGWSNLDPVFVIGTGTSLTARKNAVTVLKNGNFLINKSSQMNPAYVLDVNGTIRANEIVVNTTGADFVFEEGYSLLPLSELELTLQKEKHLPGIASAKEMQENGVGLAELNKRLLQKTEELTLYIIQLNKDQQELKDLVRAQSTEIQNLKNK